MKEIKTYGVRLDSEYLDNERLADLIITFASIYEVIDTPRIMNSKSFTLCFPTENARINFISAIESELYKGYILIKDVIVLEVK